MRKLMLFTMGFGAMALGLVLFASGLCWSIPLALLAVSLVLFFFRHKILRVLAVLLLGAVVGGLFTSAYSLRHYRQAETFCGEEIAFTAVAQDYPKSTRYGYSVQVKLTQPQASLSAILYYGGGVGEILPGDTLSGQAVFSLTYDDASHGDLYNPSKGIGYTAKVRDKIEVTTAQERGILHHLRIFSQKMKENLRSAFSWDSAGYFVALATGDRSGLDYSLRNDMSICGIYHAVSLSGMHVSILMGLIFILCGRRRRLGAMVGVPILIAFVLLSGANPATVRAVTMQSILLLTLFVPREYDAVTSLSMALLLLLLQNPWSIAQWGLQLSFLSTAGIVLLCPKLLKAYGRLRPKKKLARCLCDFITASVSVTLSATLFTLPLQIWYFGLVSLIAPLCNLLCLWAVTLSFVGALFVGIGAMVTPYGASVLARGLEWLFDYLHTVVTFFAHLPISAVYQSQPYLLCWSVLFYLLLLVLFAFPRAWKWNLIAMGVSLALCMGVRCLTLTQDGFTVLSVGQGQSIACLKEGDRYLIDCGGDSEKAGETTARYLLGKGIDHMDAVILTHFDSDHVVGLSHFLTRVKVDTLYYAKNTVMTDTVRGILDDATAQGVTTVAVENLTLPLGQGELRLYSSPTAENENDLGLYLLADTEECDILITGDLSQKAELEVLEQGTIPQVHVLVAGHHGSANSNSLALLQVASPRTVLISVGENTYGHPAQETLRRIQSIGAKAYTTLENGNLYIRW